MQFMQFKPYIYFDLLNKFFYFIDVLLFPSEIWILRGLVLVLLVVNIIMISVIIMQYRKLRGLVLIDLNKRRATRRIMRNIQTTRM